LLALRPRPARRGARGRHGGLREWRRPLPAPATREGPGQTATGRRPERPARAHPAARRPLPRDGGRRLRGRRGVRLAPVGGGVGGPDARVTLTARIASPPPQPAARRAPALGAGEDSAGPSAAGPGGG